MTNQNESVGIEQHRRPFSLRRAVAQLRIKITLPYVLLALAIAFAASYLVTRLLTGLLQNRFETALLDAGHMATDTVVRVEQDQLAAWRVIAYTDGFAEAVETGDSDAAAMLALPHLINARVDCIDVLDAAGERLLALHHRPGGDAADYLLQPGAAYADWEIVRWVLSGEQDSLGDKTADLIETEWGWVLYTAGPVRTADRAVGVLLIGTYLERVVERIDTTVLARATVYTGVGVPRVTTLAPAEPDALAIDAATYQAVLVDHAAQTLRRDVQIAGRGYAEALTAFEVRSGRDIGVLSVALPLSFVTDASQPTRELLLSIFGIATALVIGTGALVANAVVRRVGQLAAATRQVSQGDLNTRVEMRGADEVSELARDFDRMVVELREGRLYRDLLGLTTSPEIAERLRQGLQRGQLQIEAQSVVATVLFADIRGFTRLSEGQDPASVIRFLNDYLQGIIDVIRENHGVINKFAGDAALAFFGVLPEARPPEQSARDAVGAALGIQAYLVEFNRQRQTQGQAPVRTGIGVNTGLVVVGTLGSQERLEYTIIGDTVNVTQRLSSLNKEYLDYDIFASFETVRLLGSDLPIGTVRIGPIQVKGRTTPVGVHALVGV